MGYCASVAILLNEKSVEKMTAKVKEAFEKVFGRPTELKDGYRLYYMHYGNWSTINKDEQSILKFINNLDYDNEEEVEFCLTGDNDTSEHWMNAGWDCDRLCVETYISLDGEDIDSIVKKNQEKED